jgi:hypothetical protein
MLREFFSVVQGQCFGQAQVGLEALLYRLSHQVGPFERHLGQQGHAAFALHQSHDRLLVSRPNHGITLPVPNVLAAVDTRWALSNGHPHGDLPTSVLSSTQPFAPGLLAPKVLVQAAALGFVSVDAQVHRLVADRKEPSNLLRAPVVADIGLNALPQGCGNLFGIAAMTRSLSRFASSLFGSVSLEPTATFDLTANGAGVSPQQAGNLGGGVLGSHKALDLVSFFSAEVFVHWATSTWRLKGP